MKKRQGRPALVWARPPEEASEMLKTVFHQYQTFVTAYREALDALAPYRTRDGLAIRAIAVRRARHADDVKVGLGPPGPSEPEVDWAE